MVEKFQKRFPGTGRIVITNMNSKRHIMIKMAKVKNKEKNLNATREKTRITYKRTPAKLSVDVSTEILLVIRD